MYDQKAVEARWQQTWEEERLYEADPDARARRSSSCTRRRISPAP